MDDPDRMLGLYNKYDIYYKVDADQDYNLSVCDLFVLDLTHDRFAIAALQEWRRSWEAANPGKIAPDTQPYTVQRRKDKDHKHKNCEFWVLNVTVDPHCLPALKKYVELCWEEFPGLASDLRAMIRRNVFEEEEQLRWEPQVQEKPRQPSGVQGRGQVGGESAPTGEPLHEGPA